VNKKGNSNKEKIISLLRSRLENSSSGDVLFDEKITDQQLAVLLGELQIFQLELEMQNDELSASYQLLEAERSRFAGFFNLAPVGYFILDQLGIVEEANQTGADLLCISKGKLLNQRLQSFIDPVMWELFYSFLHKMQMSTERQSCEIRLALSGGQEIYTRMEGIAILNNYSSKLQYYVTVIDVSESRIAQQKLIDTTQRLEMTLGASETGVWTMDLGTHSVFLDDFSLSLMEINRWEFDGSTRKFIELIHPDDQQQIRQTLLNAIHSAKEVDMEFRVITRTGQIKTISAKGKEISNGIGNSYFAGIVMDISERKRLTLETELLQLEQQKLILTATLSAQEKERYKISNALHDSVCQLLYGIRLNLQNVQHTFNLKNEFKNVNQLLDQAIRETRELSYELTPSVLRDFGFTAGVKEMAQRLSTSSFQIKTSLKTGADLLHQDVQLYVFRIIQELINNCIKHACATTAEIIVCTENGWINVKIKDNGKGFDVKNSLSKGSGLRGIKNRVFLLNGEMDIKASVKGTAVAIRFKNDLELLDVNKT
jgi:signal transduction histidine kinase